MTEPPLVDEPHRFPVLAEELRFEGAKWSVWSETVDIDGHVVVRDVLRHPGAVAVAAVDDEGRLLLIRQYRHPVAKYLWEIPAGLLDQAGEDPLACARRGDGSERAFLVTFGADDRMQAGIDGVALT